MAAQLPKVGDIVANRYRVLQPLGEGGMGAVFVVRHTLTDKRLALKCMLPALSTYPGASQRFLREARAAGRIDHPNVIDVFDVGQDGELLFMVMELLEGLPLSEWKQAANPALETLLSVFVDAARGVHAAHARGVIHRDLKPDNIFVVQGPRGCLEGVRVLDFGVSKLADLSSGALHLTQTGATLGTPAYMSPEQLRGERSLDGRTDGYALGVMLYEALSGRLPYAADSLPALAVQISLGDATHLHERVPSLPAGLADTVMRAMALRPEERYANVDDLIAALNPFAQGGGIDDAEHFAQRARRLRRSQPQPLSWVRRRTRWLLAPAAAALVLGWWCTPEKSPLSTAPQDPVWTARPTQPAPARSARAARGAALAGEAGVDAEAGRWADAGQVSQAARAPLAPLSPAPQASPMLGPPPPSGTRRRRRATSAIRAPRPEIVHASPLGGGQDAGPAPAPVRRTPDPEPMPNRAGPLSFDQF